MLVLHHQGITSADYANQMLKMLTTLSHHVTKCQQGNTISSDIIASTILKMIIKKNHPERNIKFLNKPEYVIKIDNHEYWWNISIQTATKIPHNKPDLLVWDTD